jgi:hypothetical protein
VRIHNALSSLNVGIRGADEDLLGTFARVWLAKLANPQNGDENKVFALKILRKVDGVWTICSSEYS